MAYLNQWVGILRVIKDPVVKTVKVKGQDRDVVSMVGVSGRARRDADGNWVKDENALWVYIDAWDAVDESKYSSFDVIVQNVKAGDEVLVIGSLGMHRYQDKEGNDQVSIKMDRLEKITVLGKMNNKSDRQPVKSVGSSNYSESSDSPDESEYSDDIPF